MTTKPETRSDLERRKHGRRSRPLHVTVLQLVMTLVIATATGIGVTTYLNTRTAVQELTDRLMEEVAHQITSETRAFLQQAKPALFLTRDTLFSDPRSNMRRDNPPEDGTWRVRSAHLLRHWRAFP